MSNKVIDTYNNLIDYINSLVNKNYQVDEKCDEDQGYGFYIEVKNKHYIEISIWPDYTSIKLVRHNSNFCYDIANDVTVQKTLVKGNNTQDIINQVESYLEYSENLERVYTIELTKKEIEELMISITNKAIVEKLAKCYREAE